MKQTILGAIAGDVIGSVYEFNNTRTTDFPLFKRETTFTDDTVMTIAIADAILHNKDFAQTILDYGKRYPNRGYGTSFFKWLAHDTPAPPYNSWGNGSAMRVSAVGFAYNDLGIVLDKAAQTAEVTHNHPEGIKGAECIAEVIHWLKYMRFTKSEVERKVKKFYGYELPRLRDIMKLGAEGHFDSTCQETVPMALRCFINSNSFEDTIRIAVLCDGDTDTKACIAGAVAEAYYQIPYEIIDRAMVYLPTDMLNILDQFYSDKHII